MRYLSWFCRIIGLVLLAATLNGCGMMRVAYNQAPDALYWWLDGYFDFKETQTLRLRADLDALHAWHRANELPAYMAILGKARSLAGGDIDAAQVCGLFGEGRARVIASLERLEPTNVAIAQTLSPEQIGHLENKLDKRNRKWRADWLEGAPQKRAARRVKEAVSRAEMLYGNLDERQLAVIRASIARSGFDPQIAYRESLRREQDALGTLRLLNAPSSTPAQARTSMRALFERSTNSPDIAYRSYLETITRENCSVVADLHNSTTPAQRLKAIKTIKSYEDDFQSLLAAR
ncbi:MAG: hypothetical protein H7332_08755 [Bdellovibrionales bacterium]|nr:hypothetical protein [Ramlibacter sp.]